MPDERRGEDGGGRRAVGETVHRCRLHRGGADLLADRAVIKVHVELDEDGGEQDAAGAYGGVRPLPYLPGGQAVILAGKGHLSGKMCIRDRHTADHTIIELIKMPPLSWI